MNDQIADKNLTNGYNVNILDEIYRVMKKPNIYIWCNAEQIPMYIDFFVNNKGCKMDVILWNKTNSAPLFNNKYLTDKEYCLYFRKGGYCSPQNYEDAKTIFYQPINEKDKKIYLHPTIKPLNIISTLVRNSTKSSKDIVLDCFMGSGTTGVACVNNNVNFIGIEIDKEYFEIAKNRIAEAEQNVKDLSSFGISIGHQMDIFELANPYQE